MPTTVLVGAEIDYESARMLFDIVSCHPALTHAQLLRTPLSALGITETLRR